MVQRKRHLHQSKHPFDAYPFEALVFGSWQAAELIKIESGTMTLYFIDNHHMAMEKGPVSDIRIRSRKATLSDCSSFLRPGVDICVLSAFQCSNIPDQFRANPVWIDAKINSIERKPHKSNCSCQYYVNFYDDEGSLGTEIRTLSKVVRVVGINQISILQRLERNSCEDQHYRWDSSEDCSEVSPTKLLLGKFLSDLSWLVTASVLKKVSFCVKSVGNKILYQILGSGSARSPLNTASLINVVNFKEKDGVLAPIVSQVDVSDINRTNHAHDSGKDEVSSSHSIEGLRRSKRRNTQPDRYLGCDVSKLEVGNFRTWPYKRYKSPIKDVDSNKKVNKETVVYSRRNKTKQVKSGVGNQNQNEHQTQFASIDQFTFEPNNHPTMSGDPKKVDSSRHRYNLRSRKRQGNSFELDDMDLETRWEGINSNKGVQQKRHGSIYTRNRNHHEEGSHKGRTLNAAEYKEMIDSYLKNINTMPTEEEPPITDQWKETSNLEQKKITDISLRGDEEEMSETDMLWGEMEMSMVESYLLEGTEGSNAVIEEESKNTCPHDYRLNEEIGIYCLRCGVVKTEIRDVTAPFIERPRRRHQEEMQCGEETEPKADKDDDDSHLFLPHASRDEPISIENDNVWTLIPELREKMHVHQEKAFQFIWQIIAGSIEPALMEAESERRGGCVISHAPGAGKTFLIIAFLVSYLKLFPGKKPLILAPKTTLYTWYKEFIKWQISVPVYLIHGRRNQRDFKEKQLALPGVRNPTRDVKHVLDCLDKIQKWHAHPSVLVMGYTSFLSLMREDSKFEHKKYMAKALRESPGILILDEGHNPRNTKSRLRKGLMKVETELRILLSGTLFQNNFCEYFNTLCLARPRFVHEVLNELDPKYGRNSKRSEKARHLQESRARKFFLDNIAKKIDSDDGEERKKGLNMLRKITSGFIDVYDGGNTENLPGLQIYTLLMNTTDVQHEMLQKLHRKMAEYNGYPLEVELLITLGSIHPWLIKTAPFATKFFPLAQLKKLEERKFDLKIGSKVRFVLSLVHRVVKKEKVLIFCHNLAPVKLLVELFEKFFNWKKGREILLLNGELELFERGKVIDKFEDPGGVSKILLASITACAEGISLTAASRVIFLDSEWNPSKTKQAIARAFRPGQQKMVYVYQLLASGSLEEDKYSRTTWKEWVSSMIFSEAFVEDPSQWQAEKIEDDILREMVEGDNSKSKAIHMIMKNEKASTN